MDIDWSKKMFKSGWLTIVSDDYEDEYIFPLVQFYELTSMPEQEDYFVVQMCAEDVGELFHSSIKDLLIVQRELNILN